MACVGAPASAGRRQPVARVPPTLRPTPTRREGCRAHRQEAGRSRRVRPRPEHGTRPCALMSTQTRGLPTAAPCELPRQEHGSPRKAAVNDRSKNGSLRLAPSARWVTGPSPPGERAHRTMGVPPPPRGCLLRGRAPSCRPHERKCALSFPQEPFLRGLLSPGSASVELTASKQVLSISLGACSSPGETRSLTPSLQPSTSLDELTHWGPPLPL